jgi:23S rRNA pseudouridine1911/1915/1917 synthase
VTSDPTSDTPRPRLIDEGGKIDPELVWKSIEEFEGDDGADECRTVSITLKRDLKTRLDKYLVSRISFMSRAQIQRLISSGNVRVNDREAKASTFLRLGDSIEVVVPPPPSKAIEPEDIPLDVLFEDEHMIVLSKRADIIVHPAKMEQSGTLLNALAHHFKFVSKLGGDLSTVGEELARPGVVHRLDRDTTGCIVFAKRDEAHWRLGHQFEFRKTDKRYLALVHGRLIGRYGDDADVIDLPLGPHPSREKGYREKQVVRHDHLGKPSVTLFRVRERYTLPGPEIVGGHAYDRAFTLVELELKTGRTHQIRVHLSHTGFPIVGDDMYGGRPLATDAGDVLMDRQALHAATLSLFHPITDAPMSFTAPLPADLQRAIRWLREHATTERLDPGGATVDLAVAMSESIESRRETAANFGGDDAPATGKSGCSAPPPDPRME